MRDGVILANAGHFDVEIDVRALAGLAVEVNEGVRPHVDSFELADGRRLLLLAEGRVVNLVAAEGHPAQAMDLSFGVQALALAWLAGPRRHAGRRRARGPGPARRRGRPPGAGRDRRPDRRPHPGPVGLPGLLAHCPRHAERRRASSYGYLPGALPQPLRVILPPSDLAWPHDLALPGSFHSGGGL